MLKPWVTAPHPNPKAAPWEETPGCHWVQEDKDVPHTRSDLHLLELSTWLALTRPNECLGHLLVQVCWCFVGTSASDTLCNHLKCAMLVGMCWSLAQTSPLLNISDKSWIFMYLFQFFLIRKTPGKLLFILVWYVSRFFLMSFKLSFNFSFTLKATFSEYEHVTFLFWIKNTIPTFPTLTITNMITFNKISSYPWYLIYPQNNYNIHLEHFWPLELDI